MTATIFTREDVERFGFIYEPDKDKCKSHKLRWCVPRVINEEFKKSIVDDIVFTHIHEVKKTENPYEGDPNFLSGPRVLVIGHTRKGILESNLVIPENPIAGQMRHVVDGISYSREEYFKKFGTK